MWLFVLYKLGTSRSTTTNGASSNLNRKDYDINTVNSGWTFAAAAAAGENSSLTAAECTRATCVRSPALFV